jgi:hypothetical protein
MNTLEQAAAQIAVSETTRAASPEAAAADATPSGGVFGRLKRMVKGR